MGAPSTPSPDALAYAAGRELDINLRQLFVFMAVAQTGSATGAADALLRASSAIARTIGSMETLLGARLFDRHARGMAINAHGRAVLARAMRIAAEFRQVATYDIAGRSAVAAAPPAILPTGRRLAMIVGLAENGNMATVARAFGVTLAAVSAGLKDLEARIGAALFDRSSRGLVTTEAGLSIIPHFRRCLNELRHIETDLAALDGIVQGTVRIGALPLGRTQILPDCIASIIARYPLLRVATFESPYVQLVAQLRNGEIDFIFGALRQPHEIVDLDQTALFDDRLSVIARADHPLTAAETLALRDLLDARWVMWRPESPSRQMLKRCFVNAGLAPPQPAVETGDLAILRGLLLRSDMVAAASVDQLRYEIDRGDLVKLPVPLGPTRRSIGVATRQGALPSAGARAMIEEIRFQVSRLIGEGALFPSPRGMLER